MYPIIFQYKNLVISSYGLMLMIAFLSCNFLLKRYLKKINVNIKIGDDIIFYAAIGGILGAKIYYIIENISGDGYENIKGLFLIFQGVFMLSFDMITTGINQFGSGLVFLGGLIGGMITVSIYIKKNNLIWYDVADWVAPYLALGHSIGRIGCLLVGDCYGYPCKLPWGMSFTEGLPPTTYNSFYYNYPKIFKEYIEPFYTQTDIIKVHPTQIYESFIYLLIFVYLCRIRKNISKKGTIIFEYLFLAGISRFIIEYYRINQDYIFNLSGAQIISLFMIFISSIILYFNRTSKLN